MTQIVIACGRVIYAVDEVDRFSSAGYRSARARLPDQSGATRSGFPFGSSRRPAQVPRELTSQAHCFTSSRMTEPRDLSYLEEYSDGEAVAGFPDLTTTSFCAGRSPKGSRSAGDRKKSSEIPRQAFLGPGHAHSRNSLTRSTLRRNFLRSLRVFQWSQQRIWESWPWSSSS